MDKIYLHKNNNLELVLEKNNLYFTILSTGFNNIDYLHFLEKTELFFEKCIKTDLHFNFIIDITKVSILLINNIFDYTYKASVFLKKHDTFFETNLNKTIIIMKNKFNKKIFSYLFGFYKPKRPIEFVKNYNELNNYIND